MIITNKPEAFKSVEHQVDFCVVGGGMAGMLAAIAAARRGARVALMQDRPVLGGNASSEVRMWIRGAHGCNLRETGILEEIALSNIYRNPSLNFSVWDSVLYEAVRYQENIELILNCSCLDMGMESGQITWVKGWQTTTQTWHTVYGKLFADCSGDSVMAPLSGAMWRMGREASDEFNEDIAPRKADCSTMGMSCLIQARETNGPQPYQPPVWANRYTKADFPHRLPLEHGSAWVRDNFWWMELGGVQNGIQNTEALRDELLKVAFGVWDFIKNSGHCEADNWALDWVGFLPGKRESRRYVGDHILTQNDIRSEGRFEDVVAYGGWSMDDHHPEGMLYPGEPTIFHPAPSPYGIPYRCLYSKNVPNLLFAGRNISATHAALSSTRVMATCAMLGQAVGTAAAIALKQGVLPRGVYERHLGELQQALMEDDCYLPWQKRQISDRTRRAKLSASHGDPSVLINGVDRPVGNEYNGWIAPLGAWVQMNFDTEVSLRRIRLVLDSDLDRSSWKDQEACIQTFPMRCSYGLSQQPVSVPPTLIKAYRLEVLDMVGWKTVWREENNYQRLNRIVLDLNTRGLRLVPEKTWGADEIRVFALDVE